MSRTKRVPFQRDSKNALYYGDNLYVLRKYLNDSSVDLIYLDPPFKSDRNYNVLFKKKTDDESASDDAQIVAFTDTWTWGPDDKSQFDELIAVAEPQIATTVKSLYQILGTSDMMSYVVMMAARLIELYRVLRPGGSVFLHCDPSASHYLKILMDSIFGPSQFTNEVVWHHGLGAFSAKERFPSKHDILLFYRKPGGEVTWTKLRGDVTEAMRKKYSHKDEQGHYMLSYGKKYYLKGGKPFDDVWSIPAISPTSSERLGYPTQKPLTLLERVIKAASNEGDVVLDPFCGCGTAIIAAQSHGRKWIGIDVSFLAVELMRERIDKSFRGQVTYLVNGIPTDAASAIALHERDPFEFERWAVSSLDGFPNDRQRGDKGIDGRIRFWHDKSELKEMIVSVKGGKSLNPSMIRDLRGTMERLEKELGLLITNYEPTSGMIDEANSAGSYANPVSGRRYPRIQIITSEEILKGQRPNMPMVESPYRRAAASDTQTALDVD